MNEHLDALENPIVIGDTYGYTSSENGFSKVTIGRASKFTTTGKVTLTDIKVRRFLYGKKIDCDHANTSSVSAHLVFPVK